MLILRVWRAQPGKYFCIATKSRSGKWEERFFKKTELRKVKPYLDENSDKDLYWCPQGFRQPRRRKEHAAAPKVLWADLDEVQPSRIQPMPTVAWASSPGRFQALWFCDKRVTESLNRRLTYSLGADKAGWDWTQVLRVPNTKNYKYKTAPRVRMLWHDGPSYTVQEIEKKIPEDAEEQGPEFGEAYKIFKKYEKKLTAFARREILGGKPKVGKRSEVLWRLNQECIEAGMTTEEAFLVLRVSPWNKFKKRRNGDNQLRRELEKAVERKLESEPVEPEDLDGRFLTQSLADIEAEQIDWIWYPYLARGELTILEGDPGLGKSYLAEIVGRHIVDGKRLPSVKTRKRVRGRVAYFDIENDPNTVTKNRMLENACRNMKDYYQETTPFMIDDDEALDVVYEALERVRPTLVVFDTVNTYIGRADTHKTSETQQAMGQFLEIAKRFNCAVLVLRHLTKSTKEKALYRGQGSIAFAGIARVVLTVGSHPDEDDTLVMAVTKLNVAKRPPALTFSIVELPDTLKRQDRSRFDWGDFVDLTSDDIVTVVQAAKSKGRDEELEEALREILSEGPLTRAKVERAAKARGIHIKQLDKVAKRIGVIRDTRGFGKKRVATWSLPSD
jgi:archaellum biogenesis ATPase FlaH